MASNYKITFVTDETTEEKIRNLAEQEGVSVSKFVRNFICEYLNVDWGKHKELSEIGKVCGIKPTDLVNSLYVQKINSIGECLAGVVDV
jgi:hypothetical protein